MSAEPEREPLPGEWDARLDPLQKLIIVRCIRTDRVSPHALSLYISQRVGQEYVEPPSFDLEGVFDESTNKTPMLFVLTPGMDPTTLLRALAAHLSVQWQAISLGQGQAPKASKMIADAADQGFWHSMLKTVLTSR